MASIKLKGDTSGEVTISAPAVAGTTTLTLPATSSTLATQNALGVRNLIINGDMRIAQRGTSVTGISNSADYRTVDRWRFAQQSTTGVFTMSQDTDVPVGQGFTYSVKMQCTTADTTLGVNDRIAIWQGIEGNMLQSYIKGTNATKATLSFWVKTNKTGTYNLELNDTDNIRHICNTFTVDAADTWQKITWVIDADTGGNPFDNGTNGGMYVNIVFGAGSNYQSGTLATTWSTPVTQGNRYVGASNLADSTSNYINITGIQLEVGTEATPFEHRPYDMELARCQRYYQFVSFFGVAANTGEMGVTGPFRTEMRASPALSVYSTSGTGVYTTEFTTHTLTKIGQGQVTVGNLTTFFLGPRGLYNIYCTGLATGGIYVGTTYVSAEL